MRKMPWRRAWQPTPVFLFGEFHGGAWQATVHRVTKSQARLSDFHFTSLEDIKGSVPGHCNKANIAIQSTEFLLFPSAFKSYVILYCSVLSLQ